MRIFTGKKVSSVTETLSRDTRNVEVFQEVPRVPKEGSIILLSISFVVWKFSSSLSTDLSPGGLRGLQSK